MTVKLLKHAHSIAFHPQIYTVKPLYSSRNFCTKKKHNLDIYYAIFSVQLRLKKLQNIFNTPRMTTKKQIIGNYAEKILLQENVLN